MARAPTEHRQQTHLTHRYSGVKIYFLKYCEKGGKVLDENAEQAGEQFASKANMPKKLQLGTSN